MNRPQLRNALRGILSMALCVSLYLTPGMAQEQSAQDPPVKKVENSTSDKDARRSPSDTAKSDQPQPLTEQEAAELRARADQPGPEVVGGALSNLHLTYIVIALAAAVLVLILK